MKFETVDNPKDDVFVEKGFFAVLCKSAFVVGRTSDFIISSLIFIVSSTYLVVGEVFFNLIDNPAVGLTLIKSWSAIGATFSVAILGFLIAGFSIFATITKPELFTALASVRKSTRDISEFKFIFFNFMYIFAYYIFYSAVCMGSWAFVDVGGPIWYISGIFYSFYPDLVEISIGIYLILIVSLSVYALFLLRGFIWNLYQSMLISIFSGS